MTYLSRIALALTVLVGVAILPAYVAPCAVMLTTESSAYGQAADAAFLGYFGRMDSWAHGNRYGFSVGNGPHLEPRDSLALLRGLNR